jgi:tRNA pseudouridine38-40 synthase
MKIAMGVEYAGTHFCGWQIQKEGIRTVQLVVEEALSQIANHPVRVFCSGRTDSGVHAKEQVIHFHTFTSRDINAWILGGNRFLPDDVNFLWAKVVHDNFHARFNAFARKYHYHIHNSPIRSALKHNRYLFEPRKLNINAMQEAANYLLGEHDFSSFRGIHCQAKTPIKTIEHLTIFKEKTIITIDIKANAFLHHMVRNIVGTLLKIGYGDKPVIWMKEVLDAQDRTQAGMTAPAHGLYFIKAFYENI